MIEYGKKCETLEEFRCYLAEVAEHEKLNMSQNWREITEKMWANDKGRCLCQCSPNGLQGVPRCACYAGLIEAHSTRCFCNLFHSQNEPYDEE